MIKFIFYNMSTGMVMGWGSCLPDRYIIQQFPGCLKMQYDGDPKTVWVDLETLEIKQKILMPEFDRTEISCINGEVATCSGLPLDAEFCINGEEWNLVGDGSLEVEADLPGTYVVQIRAPSMVDAEETIYAY
jgi:hypothetical protein